jgi:acetyl-CoA acetyltransferase family protein
MSISATQTGQAKTTAIFARAAAAIDAGAFSDEIVAVPHVDQMQDESIRRTTSLDGLAALRPVFRPNDGTVTAGDSSPLNDGAACLLLADETGVARIGRDPLARIVARGISAVTPQHFGIGPVEAANMALKRAGIGWSDLAAVELNEAFAAQSLACLAEWPELNPEVVNPLGGAIAIGHPLGASGTRLLGTLAWQLRRAGGRLRTGRHVHRRRPGHRRCPRSLRARSVD